MENLSASPVGPDTLYTRYSFNREKVNISFSPGWYSDYSLNWLLDDHYLTMGYETYLVEELTDSTLVFSKENFRRFHLVSEAVYSKSKRPDTTVSLNGQSVYEASTYLTARYKKEQSFYTGVQHELEKNYSVRHANMLIARFVVTAQGKVERVEVVKSISAGFDNDVVKLIRKSSGDWYPARMDNIPVDCEMTLQIKYLDSIAPNFGVLNDSRIQL